MDDFFLSALFIPAILYCIVVLAMSGMAPWERDCEHGDAGARDRREAGAARHNRGPHDNRRYPPRLDHTDGVLGVLCPLPLRSSSTNQLPKIFMEVNHYGGSRGFPTLPFFSSRYFSACSRELTGFSTSMPYPASLPEWSISCAA